MTADEAAALAETFLRDYLAERHPPPAAGTDPAEDFSVAIQRVTAEEGALRAVFGVGMPFRYGDPRAPERINACLHALHAAHPELRAFRLDVTAVTVGP